LGRSASDAIVFRKMKIVVLIVSFMFCFAQCDGKANIAQNSLVKLETTVSPTPKPSPGFPQSREKKMDKETLAERVEPLDATVSQVIRAENSQIQDMATPFLRDGIIYKVSKFAPTRPIIIFVGVVENDYTALIGGDAEKYFEFVKKAKVALDNDELRKAYILNFLEVTKSGSKRLQILESVADIKMRPNLNESQKKEFDEFQEKYKSVIKPLKKSEEGIYKVFAVKKQDLVRIDLTIKQDGIIEKQETVLESDILIPYSL